MACVGTPAVRPYVDWKEGDIAAGGVALYDSTSPEQIVEGAMVFGAIPLGDVEFVSALQLDFAGGFSSTSGVGFGGSGAVRYRWRVLDAIEFVPEVSFGYLVLRTPSGLREQAALSMFDLSIRYGVVETVWVYVRPGAGAGAAVYGTSLGSVFPAVRLSYGAQWEAQHWLRVFMEGNVSTQVGGAFFTIGVLSVF